MHTARNIDEDVRRSLSTHHLHSTFSFEDEGKDEDIPPPRRSSSIDHAVNQAFSQVQIYTERPSVSHQNQPSSEHSGGDSGFGSNGDEEYSSTHIGGSFSNEGDGLHLESEQTWETISI